VQEWRTRVETNLDDVLQSNTVFVNVSKGEVAKTNDLQKAFDDKELEDIVREILDKGEVQVGEKEREHDLTSLRKEIATLVAEKTVDPATQRPHPVGMIEKAMTEAGYSVKQNKNAKGQMSDCIRILQSQSTLSIERAKMTVKMSIPAADRERLEAKLPEGVKVEHHLTVNDDWEATMRIDPSQFRVISELLQKECKGSGRLETLAFAATVDGS